MKMEMSYRDKMILLGLLIIAILLLGFFFLIKPAYATLQDSTEDYTAVKEKSDQIDQKINMIPTLKDTITKAYEEADKVAEIFVNTAFVTANETLSHEKTYYELDQYIQGAIDDSAIEVSSMELDQATAEVVEYYYYTPDVLTYALMESADINDNYALSITETMLDSLVLAEREQVEIMRAEMTITGDATKNGLLTFLDKIEADTNAVLVTGLDINNYEFTDGLEEDINGNFIVTPGVEGTSEITMVVSFYNAKEIDKPDLGA